MKASLDLRVSAPAVALETAFLTRGLPEGVRLDAARAMARAARAEGAEPAFVGVLAGRVVVGLDEDELERLAACDRKLSTRDLAAAAARGEDGGTTVAATVALAYRAGLAVAATGGIGGVHPGSGRDVSADLEELARTPIVLVCSGAKAITVIRDTVERLETLGVAIAGWRTRELAAFWSVQSGIGIDLVVASAAEVAEIHAAARTLGIPGALVVCVPPPPEAALTRDESERAVGRALSDLEAGTIAGPDVTPFLLARIAELTEGRSLRANLALLARNAGVAASIAREIVAG